MNESQAFLYCLASLAYQHHLRLEVKRGEGLVAMPLENKRIAPQLLHRRVQRLNSDLKKNGLCIPAAY